MSAVGVVLDLTKISFVDSLNLVSQFRGTNLMPITFIQDRPLDLRRKINHALTADLVPILIDDTGECKKPKSVEGFEFVKYQIDDVDFKRSFLKLLEAVDSITGETA